MRSPAEIVMERLQRLAQGAQDAAARLPGVEVVDAEPTIVEVIEVSTNGEEDQA